MTRRRPRQVPGLTCARCAQPFDRILARPTRDGYVHATECPDASPRRLTEDHGSWVTVRGIARWVPTATPATVTPIGDTRDRPRPTRRRPARRLAAVG